MYNEIDAEGAKKLAVIFQDLQNLTSLGLNLEKNIISNEGAEIIGEAVS